MKLLRTAALALTFASTLIAHAEPMPAMPESGVSTNAPLPPIPDMSGRGAGPGGLDAGRIERVLRAAKSAVPPVMRGQAEQTLFKTYARSVVLIVTKESLGSGSVINADGTILTNAHVVAGYKSVGVIFKPMAQGVEPREADAVNATVVRVDEVADLALIKVSSVPSDVRPLRLGDLGQVQVGQDVHAIGHPFGEAWSYTKGIVSQVRFNYEWESEEDHLKHRADVVQTQTPINPGNSGGPLFNDAGEIVGVNAFGSLQGSGVSFAIAPTEVRRVLAMTSDRLAAKAQVAGSKTGKCDEPVRLATERNRKDDATVFLLDADCNGRADSGLVVPDSNARPIFLFIDANENGKNETVYVDKNHDMKFDYVVYDTNEDGKADLIGYDLNDELEPGRVVLART